jgi:putative molybdopterin biosynthesis protein
MDGIAVRSEDTLGAYEQNPVTLNDFARVNTGNVIPPGYDAVIMIEDVRLEGSSTIIRKAASPWQHVRPAGEDIAESEMVLPSDHRIRPHETGALAAYGFTSVPVLTVRVGLIPTGSELVPAGTRPLPGQVVESNTIMAGAWLRSLGCSCQIYPVIPDEPDKIRAAIIRAVAENDVVIVSAGSSAGTRDFTAPVLDDIGRVLVHGVGIRPGKPVIIGKVEEKPLLGMYGINVREHTRISTSLAATLHSEIGTTEFVLLAIGKIHDRWVSVPLSRGSGVQMSGVRANAFLTIPPDLEGYEAGSEVHAELLVEHGEAASSLLVTGSHDPSIDYLTELAQKNQVSIHSSHTGSMGGLLALKRDSCHAAPIHLLDPSGEYNLPFLKRYLPGEDITLVCVAERMQGIVSRGSLSLSDIPGHSFVNRQKGSGTRLLLDYELGRLGISPASIPGYDRELPTHIAVALAVKQGEADAGMCVYSAAKALDLPFVPVGKERYEMAIRTMDLGDPRIVTLIEELKSAEFRDILSRLGGYDTKETGVQRTTL